MERLKAEDVATGVEEKPLSEAQKAAIGEARRAFSSRVAEREILFRDALGKTPDPARRAQLEEEFRIDRGRFESDRDRAIERIRRG